MIGNQKKTVSDVWLCSSVVFQSLETLNASNEDLGVVHWVHSGSTDKPSLGVLERPLTSMTGFPVQQNLAEQSFHRVNKFSLSHFKTDYIENNEMSWHMRWWRSLSTLKLYCFEWIGDQSSPSELLDLLIRAPPSSPFDPRIRLKIYLSLSVKAKTKCFAIFLFMGTAGSFSLYWRCHWVAISLTGTSLFIWDPARSSPHKNLRPSFRPFD